jgi:hypothetical protein
VIAAAELIPTVIYKGGELNPYPHDAFHPTTVRFPLVAEALKEMVMLLVVVVWVVPSGRVQT